MGFIGSEGEDIMHAAEFGVVMMLFIIGLELNPQSFWNMRKSIFGMGLTQLLGTAGMFYILFYGLLDYSLNASIAVSFSLSMSSTINFELILGDPVGIVSFVLLIMAVKGGVLFAIGRLFKLHSGQNTLFALLFSHLLILTGIARTSGDYYVW